MYEKVSVTLVSQYLFHEKNRQLNVCEGEG